MRLKSYEFVIGIMIVFIIGCSIGTIKCKAVEMQTHDNQYIEELEQNYRNLIQDSLEEEGYYYSGVTMTKIFKQDGTTLYRIKIHNSGFDRLSTEEQEKLVCKLGDIQGITEIAQIRKEFLVLNF